MANRILFIPRAACLLTAADTENQIYAQDAAALHAQGYTVQAIDSDLALLRQRYRALVSEFSVMPEKRSPTQPDR